MHAPNFTSARLVRTGLAGLLAAAGFAALASGCLDRPVSASTPITKNLIVDSVKQGGVDKIDILFMIDNSISMADKQAILGTAVPQLVDRLISPIDVCVDDKTGKLAPANGQPCPAGSTGPRPEFKPVNDIHVGVVTSSLGGHGNGSKPNFCNPGGPDDQPGSTNNDKGHLLPKVRTGLPDYQKMGFLDWDGKSQTAEQFKGAFADHVTAAGEKGCGFESSLEAWYRFLVDPAPPAAVEVAGNSSARDGVDQEVLEERKNFLRPDSLLAIIMLTDEDDCSISDSGLGWLVARQDHMPRATAACASDPDSPCCRSCALAESSPPPGCKALGEDTSCQKDAYTDADKGDSVNLRCFDQKRRFGLDLLYPTERYVNALSNIQICPERPDLVCKKGDAPQANPLFSDLASSGAVPRDPSLVFLTAITGVPWQDIATDGRDHTPDTLHSPDTLQYKTAQQLTDDGVWDLILGDVNRHIAPRDPLMVESIEPRSGDSPITHDALAAPGAGVGANPINGHEYDIPGRDDLQYACIFPLAAPQPATADCGSFGQADASPNKPLCQASDGSYGTTQYYAKAYPGLRQLQVLKDFGENSIVASICPKVTGGDPADRNYGYNPAVGAIIDRLKDVLGVKCLPRRLAPDPVTRQVPCKVVEALPDDSPNKYDCGSKPGRAPLTGEDGQKLESAVRSRLRDLGQCDGAGQPSCADFSMCEILQLTDKTGLQSCLDDDPVEDGVNGYCYVDENQGNPAFINRCHDTERHLLRFVPQSDTPTRGANAFIACAGAAFPTN